MHHNAINTPSPDRTVVRAAVCRQYGAPEVATVELVPAPALAPGDVLVRVEAASVGSADSASRQGQPRFVRLFFGLRRPRNPVLGSDFAGVVVGMGDEVSDFSMGDRVFGSTGAAMATHAELIVVAQTSAIVRLPEAVSYEQACALGDGGMTALPFLRDTASLRAGQRVLVNGASGAVGSAAVQIAKHLGATVTAVTSGPNLSLVRELGADYAIDYTLRDFTAGTQRWDVVFDAVGTSNYRAAKRVLTPRGIYLSTVPGGILLQSLFTKRAAISFTGLRSDAAKRPDLVELARLTAEGRLAPLHDSSFPMGEVARAHARVDSKRKRGTVVLLPHR